MLMYPSKSLKSKCKSLKCKGLPNIEKALHVACENKCNSVKRVTV